LVNIFNDPDAFVSDAAFLFLLASVIVFIFGPGVFSVDAILKRRFAGSSRKEPMVAASTAQGTLQRVS
jgi:hypothetical protein